MAVLMVIVLIRSFVLSGLPCAGIGRENLEIVNRRFVEIQTVRKNKENVWFRGNFTAGDFLDEGHHHKQKQDAYED